MKTGIICLNEAQVQGLFPDIKLPAFNVALYDLVQRNGQCYLSYQLNGDSWVYSQPLKKFVKDTQ